MTFHLTDMLYVALIAYALGTVIALVSLFTKEKLPQHLALIVMTLGFIAQTIWIGTICARTGHPPLTNLPEAAAFLSWTIFLFELILYIRYRVYAASFFVYPLVLLLQVLSAVIGESYVHLDPALRSNMFTAHILLSTVGVAGLLIGLAFTVLAYLQDRALKSKHRGALWDWIPSLSVCRMVSYRALAIGFSVYTLGLIAGVLWSYRTTAELMEPRVKQIGAVIAWILFAALLQMLISGSYRRRRTIVLSACAFVAIMVAILGIDHV
jgi:ABC-type transport system involved in cytochrome c biogenesis permease subunit